MKSNSLRNARQRTRANFDRLESLAGGKHPLARAVSTFVLPTLDGAAYAATKYLSNWAVAWTCSYRADTAN